VTTNFNNVCLVIINSALYHEFEFHKLAFCVVMPKCVRPIIGVIYSRRLIEL